MKSEMINLPGKRLGPYSDAVRVGGLLFLAGRVGMGEDGNLVEGGIGPETEQAIKNVSAVLSAAKLDLKSVIKCTVYLVDMGDFGAMNEAYQKSFGENRPSRTAVAVAALPLNARFEIDVIATA